MLNFFFDLVIYNVTQKTANKQCKTVDQSQRTRGFNMKTPPKAEGKNRRRKPTNLHYIECAVTKHLTAAYKRYIWSNLNVYHEGASATLRSKSVFICI